MLLSPESVARCLHKIEEQRRRMQALYQKNNVEDCIVTCSEQQYLAELARLRRMADDEVFYAYHHENGIRYKLQSFVDFVMYRMSEKNDVATIFLIAYNQNLDMAAYQWRKLTAKRNELQLQAVGLKPLSAGEFRAFIGWIDVESEFAELERSLKLLAAKDEFGNSRVAQTARERMTQMAESLRRTSRDRSNYGGELDEQERRILVISTEIDELTLKPGSNLQKLTKMAQAVQKMPLEYTSINDDLYEALQDHLAPERLAPLKVTDSLGTEEYCKLLSEFAQIIDENVLHKWPAQ